jgi:hypothetical protein
MSQTIDSQYFLNKILSTYTQTFSKLHFTDDPWKLDDNKRILSTYYELQALETLSKAFRIHQTNYTDLTVDFQEKVNQKSNFKYLLDGDFLERYPFLPSYPNVLQKFQTFHHFFRPNLLETHEVNHINIIRIYRKLINFRLTIYQAIEKGNVIPFEGKGLEPNFCYYIMRQTVVNEVDFILKSILDPNNQVFTKEQLIKDFDYPSVDIEKIRQKELRDFIDDFWA